MNVVLVTVGFAFVVFALLVSMMSVKVLFKKRTPMREHACTFMCRHGKNQVCVCNHEEGEECNS